MSPFFNASLTVETNLLAQTMPPAPPAIQPRPPVTSEIAAEIALRLYGITGRISELGSTQDRNFRVGKDDGSSVVLKIANASWSQGALQAQDTALQLLHATDAFSAPIPVPSLDGKLIEHVEIAGGRFMIRCLTFVEGNPLPQSSYLAPKVVEALGTLAGECTAALKEFDHPGLDRDPGQWDLRGARELIAGFVPSVSDERKRTAIGDATTAAWTRVEPLIPKLRIQAIHGDITDDNVVSSMDEAGRLIPNGIIDFGDLSKSWTVGEIVVTASCILRHPLSEALATILPAVKAFHEKVQLSEEEVSAFWPLLVLRAATLVVAGEHQALLDPDNPSVTEAMASESTIFLEANRIPADIAEAAIRTALGWPASTRYDQQLAAMKSSSGLLPSLDVSQLSIIDLGVTSAELHSGLFLEGDESERKLLRQPTSGAATRWGEARLTRTKVNSAVPPDTVALGVDLQLPNGIEVRAPLAGTMVFVGIRAVILDTAAGWLLLSGLDVLQTSSLSIGSKVEAGTDLGKTSAEMLLHVQVCLEKSMDPLEIPEFVAAGPLGDAWLSLCPDPSHLIGVSLAAPRNDTLGLLKRREATFAKIQEHYYDDPMQIERGWRHYLIDVGGRSYVDTVNNVASIGHSHPVLAEAVNKQLHLLNSNSRFHYAAVAELSEELVKLAPPGLDTVLLVNSGSEAVDLALRMAQTVTNRMEVISLLEAYHGWTMLSDAVTTSLYDNPRALETRPDWIHLCSSINSFRGPLRGPEAETTAPHGGYSGHIRTLVSEMVSKNRPPAAFICEPLLGNAGGIILPSGFLSAAYDSVRAAGGYVIADEVQVGFGRTGEHFWAHEAHGVVPDMITIAKCMGNGFPIGAVICRREIAEAFRTLNARFFSSAGGSPASCAAGLAVLKVLRDENLQQNALTIGSHIIARCTHLAKTYPLIGHIHGRGLYLGIELVRSRETLEPATAECYAICDRLRELGCIVQPTGERANILKVKGPMCMTLESADFFMDMLQKTLEEGW
jgi:4-aminobutyrate aminotransferase-like enzyme/Ser/Thr protein kinase RdoA (MazF antagonist)